MTLLLNFLFQIPRSLLTNQRWRLKKRNQNFAAPFVILPRISDSIWHIMKEVTPVKDHTNVVIVKKPMLNLSN